VLRSEKLTCPNCGDKVNLTFFSTSVVTLFHTNSSFDIIVVKSQCPVCEEIFSVDEAAAGIFLANANTGLSFELLFDYLHSFFQGTADLTLSDSLSLQLSPLVKPLSLFSCLFFQLQGNSTFTAFNAKQALNYGLSLTAPLGYERFRHSWNTFLSLLKFDAEGAFTCDACGGAPSTVLFDATLLACRKDFLLAEEQTSVTVVANVGSAHRKRVLFLKKEQTLINNFLKASPELPFSRAKLGSLAVPSDIANFLDFCCTPDQVTCFWKKQTNKQKRRC